MKKLKRKREAWTDAEVQLLKDTYFSEPVKTIAKTLGRTPDSVYFKASTLNLYRRPKTQLQKKQTVLRVNAKLPRWSDEEIAFLTENQDKMTTTQIAKKLGRSYNAVVIKRATLNSKVTKPIKQVVKETKVVDNKKTSWSVKDEETVKNLYNKISLSELAKKLGRSEAAVKSRAYALELIPKNTTSKIKWSQAEIDYVRKNVDKKSLVEIARYLGRSAGAVSNLMSRHKISRSFPKKGRIRSWIKPTIITVTGLASVVVIALLVL